MEPLNLELTPEVMAALLQEKDKLIHWLTYLVDGLYSAGGPAIDDVIYITKENYLEEGHELPPGWGLDD